jgi:hypothetical protein
LASDLIQGFIPTGFAESRHHFVVIDNTTGFASLFTIIAPYIGRKWALGVKLWSADEWPGEALGMGGIVKTIPAFDTEAEVIDRTVPTVHIDDIIRDFIHMKTHGTPHATVRTNRVYCLELGTRLESNGERFVGESTSGTGSHTLPTRDTCALSHREIQVKADTGCIPFSSATDYLIALDFITATNTAITENTGLVIH